MQRNDKQVLENHVKELTGRFSGGFGGGKDDAQLRSQILALTRKVPVYLLILWESYYMPPWKKVDHINWHRLVGQFSFQTGCENMKGVHILPNV